MTEIEKLLRDYLNYLEIEKNRSPKTRENYEHYLNEFLKFSKIKSAKDLTDGVVREFRLALARRDLKKITQSYYVIAIRNFLKYLAKRDVKALAAEKIELPKTPSRQIEVLEYGDLERLLAAPKGNDIRALRDRPDRQAELTSIACPTLVIVGKEDKISPPAEMSALASAISEARLVEIPGAGHLSNLENPNDFVAALKHFI